MYSTLFIDWMPDIEAFHIGSVSIRWYSLLWVIGLIGAYFIVKRLYRQQNIPDEKFDPLFIYCFVGVLAGARLGHCLFYESGYFLGSAKGFIEMFVPVHFARDSWEWHYSGYTGLASHGGAIGVLIAIILYVRNTGVKFFTVMDNVCISVPFIAGSIRLGNLMNSEIIGSPTDVPWAFIFHTNDALVGGQLAPRHPAQLYEAIAYFVILILIVMLYRRNKSKVGTGLFFGFLLLTVFSFRFLIEFIKMEQVDFEQGMLLNMGQLLSIPFILTGIYFLVRAVSNNEK